MAGDGIYQSACHAGRGGGDSGSEGVIHKFHWIGFLNFQFIITLPFARDKHAKKDLKQCSLEEKSEIFGKTGRSLTGKGGALYGRVTSISLGIRACSAPLSHSTLLLLPT